MEDCIYYYNNKRIKEN
ncbi:hypothetical protein RN96_00235 [Fusobacterium polymorphum]|uniref:Uncharacterized protein n=1 Tax=Fusobacterium nucleatum subsp. polymorphum TaxID=76857 RepID=A0A2B7YFG0_FUSNP|nr:hypothetical protein RN96_00235 [Fusobacterium polymorphum]